MRHYIIKNLDKLRRVLEDHRNPVLRKIYASYVGSEPVSVRVNMYEHPDGCIISGKPGRWWVYVNVMGKSGVEYDIALWKLMKFREVQDLLRHAVSTANEEKDEVLT